MQKTMKQLQNNHGIWSHTEIKNAEDALAQSQAEAQQKLQAVEEVHRMEYYKLSVVSSVGYLTHHSKTTKLLCRRRRS